jgi:hypothetical protein
MSPQMNGEPRDEAILSPTDTQRDVARPISTQGADRTLPKVINTDGVAKTAVRRDADLAPLFTQDATAAFRARWDLVQRGFVDDPRQAVSAADELVTQVTKELAENFASQRSKLDKGLDAAGEPSTENLRIALRQYRAFFERLLSI